MSAVYGLDNILSGGTEFITFESGKPMELLFIDWYERLAGVREHYEASLTPKYVRCPGKEICPLCQANPGKYPAFRVKFRVFDPKDQKIKFVSLAKSHIKSINNDFMLDDIDPTQQYVRIVRSGNKADDTSYSARATKTAYPKCEINWETNVLAFDGNEYELPDIRPQLEPHTPEEIRGFMDALISGAAAAEMPVEAGVEQKPPKSLPF